MSKRARQTWQRLADWIQDQAATTWRDAEVAVHHEPDRPAQANFLTPGILQAQVLAQLRQLAREEGADGELCDWSIIVKWPRSSFFTGGESSKIEISALSPENREHGILTLAGDCQS
jgi:hypothetical protein